jgi:hypothetical protein
MAAANAMIAENCQAPFHQLARNALVPVARHNRQVMEKATPPVVSAEDGCNQLIANAML